MLAHLAASWVTCGAMLANREAMLAYLRAMLPRLGAMLAHLGAMLAHLWAHVGPSWSYVGPTWSSVGPTWSFFVAFVGPSGRIWTQLEPQQRTSRRARKYRKIQCFVGSGATTEPEPSAILTLIATQVPYLDARLPLDGPISTYVGRVLTHVGRKLAHVGRMFAQLSRTVAHDGRTTDRGARATVGQPCTREPRRWSAAGAAAVCNLRLPPKASGKDTGSRGRRPDFPIYWE